MTTAEIIEVLKAKEYGLVEYLLDTEFADAVQEAIKKIEEQEKEIASLKSKEDDPLTKWLKENRIQWRKKDPWDW